MSGPRFTLPDRSEVFGLPVAQLQVFVALTLQELRRNDVPSATRLELIVFAALCVSRLVEMRALPFLPID